MDRSGMVEDVRLCSVFNFLSQTQVSWRLADISSFFLSPVMHKSHVLLISKEREINKSPKYELREIAASVCFSG